MVVFVDLEEESDESGDTQQTLSRLRKLSVEENAGHPSSLQGQRRRDGHRRKETGSLAAAVGCYPYVQWLRDKWS